MANNDMMKLGGLWANKDKDGNTYLTGKLSPGVKILIFKNKYRESENHPTHLLYLAPVEQPQGEENKPEEEDEFFAEATEPAPRPMAPRSPAPAPRTPAPAPARAAAPAPAPARPAAQRRPAPPPADDELDDPFAE